MIAAPAYVLTDAHQVMLEEYRQLYALVQLRLNALEQRVPIAGALITALLGSSMAFTLAGQGVLLLAIPFSLLWLLRTTLRHTQAFHDAVQRIAAIESTINAAAAPLLTFQHTHPSFGKVGGRTGNETVETVLTASATVLGGALYLAQAAMSATSFCVYAAFVFAIATGLIAIRWHAHHYTGVHESESVTAAG